MVSEVVIFTWKRRWSTTRNGDTHYCTASSLQFQEPRRMAKMDTALQAISHIDRTQWQGRSPADQHYDLLYGRWSRRYCQEFYFRRRRREEIRQSKREIWSTFHHKEKRDLRTCKVQHEKTRTQQACQRVHNRPVLFVWALRIWSPQRIIDPWSYRGRVARCKAERKTSNGFKSHTTNSH